MKKILSLVAACLVAVAADAIVVQKLILKDGSVLSGYIQRQSDGKLTFRSDEATISMDSKDAVISNEKNYLLSTLDKSWQAWAELNDTYEGTGDSRTLALADVSGKTKSVSRVRIMERGAVVKYLEMTPNTYTVAWKDVEAITGEKRDRTALSGINRIYLLKSGMEFEGQYAEENDSMLTLWLANGVRQSFPINDVVKYTFRPINPNQDIFEQSELLDVVRSKNGGETKGIIIEQNYTSEKDSENYFLVQQESGAIQSIKVADIAEIRKEENPKYDPQFDILLDKGQVVINRQEVDVIGVKEAPDHDQLLLDSISRKVVLPYDVTNNTKVTVEYRSPAGLNVESYKLVKLTETPAKKKKDKPTYSFTYRDLVNAVYRPTRMETSVNHTTKCEYVVGGKGYYVLYDGIEKKGIPFVIE